MIIERKDKEIIFRLKSDLSADTLQDYVEMLQFEEITSKSKASQEEVDDLVKRAKRGRWAHTKTKVGL